MLTSVEHWAVALASFSTGLVREVMVAVVYIHCCIVNSRHQRQSAYLSTTRDHRHSRAPKNKNKRFRDAERKKEEESCFLQTLVMPLRTLTALF